VEVVFANNGLEQKIPFFPVEAIEEIQEIHHYSPDQHPSRNGMVCCSPYDTPLHNFVEDRRFRSSRIQEKS
jgi:hypothetical protein